MHTYSHTTHVRTFFSAWNSLISAILLLFSSEFKLIFWYEAIDFLLRLMKYFNKIEIFTHFELFHTKQQIRTEKDGILMTSFVSFSRDSQHIQLYVICVYVVVVIFIIFVFLFLFHWIHCCCVHLLFTSFVSTGFAFSLSSSMLFFFTSLLIEYPFNWIALHF